MKQAWLGILPLLLLSSCAGWMYGSQPKQDMIALAVPADQGYLIALFVFQHQFGGKIEQQDSQGKTLQGIIHNAVRMTVSVVPLGGGSQAIITGSIIPHTVVVGAFTEVEEYARAVQQQSLKPWPPAFSGGP